MGRLISISAGICAAMLLASPAVAETATEQRVEAAMQVLNDFTGIPERGIPPSILQDAYGVAVIPDMAKLGFVIGGRFGRGILVVRQKDGTWSNPAFISMGGGSIGWQIGGQSTDLVLVFRNPRSVEKIANGSFTLGGDASVAAGPVGRSSMAATDYRFKAEIFSYSRNRGLFAGIALDGSWLSMDETANEAYYKNGMSPWQILSNNSMPAPIAAQQFVDMLAAITPRINTVPLSRTAERNAGAEIRQPAEVKTYAIDPVTEAPAEPQLSGDETVF